MFGFKKRAKSGRDGPQKEEVTTKPALEHSASGLFISIEAFKLIMSWSLGIVVLLELLIFAVLALILWDPGHKFSECFVPMVLGVPYDCDNGVP